MYMIEKWMDDFFEEEKDFLTENIFNEHKYQ